MKADRLQTYHCVVIALTAFLLSAALVGIGIFTNSSHSGEAAGSQNEESYTAADTENQTEEEEAAGQDTTDTYFTVYTEEYQEFQ